MGKHRHVAGLLFGLLAACAAPESQRTTAPGGRIEPGSPQPASAFALPPTGAAAGTEVTALPPAPPWTGFPGEFALRTRKGFYVTAIDGGGRTSPPVIVTASTTAGAWEQFRIAVMNPAPSHDKRLQTASGNFLTAVNGGGLVSDSLHTDATQVRDWERFRILDLGAGGVAPTYFALQTIRGNYLTAVGEGGRYQDAMHTDATQINAWERMRIVKCGDLGSGYEYTIITATDESLTAVNGGGLATGEPIVQGWWPGDTPDRSWARFRLLRQPDGSYALRTANGVNYLTALQGGGLVERHESCDTGFPGACLDSFSAIFHTDATQVRSWERFRFVDEGSCKYSIQTTSGFYMGVFRDSSGYMLLTTRRSTVSDNEKFELVMHGLASPPVLQ